MRGWDETSLFPCAWHFRGRNWSERVFGGYRQIRARDPLGCDELVTPQLASASVECVISGDGANHPNGC